MTVSTLQGVAVPEPAAELVAAAGGAMVPNHDAAGSASGVAAVFPMLLQLLQRTAEPALAPAEPGAPLTLDGALVRALLPVAHGARMPEVGAGETPEPRDETEADGTEPTLLAALPVPPPIALAPAALAAVPPGAPGERPLASPEPRLLTPVSAPPPSPSPLAPPGMPGANGEGLDAQPFAALTPTETTPESDGVVLAPARLPEATAGLPDQRDRLEPVGPGTESGSLRAEARGAGIGPVRASGDRETRNDARGGDSSRDSSREGDRGAVEPDARVERAVGSGLGVDSQIRATHAVRDAPASAEPAAARPLVEQVVTRLTPLRQGRQEVSLRLDPPDLGAVRVEATLDGQRLTLRITAEQESARTLLEGALPRLRESLSQQGFVADQLTVQLGLDASSRDLNGRAFPRFDHPVPTDPPPRAHEAVSAPARWREASTDGLDLWA